VEAAALLSPDEEHRDLHGMPACTAAIGILHSDFVQPMSAAKPEPTNTGVIRNFFIFFTHSTGQLQSTRFRIDE
jgi:hypothetical protein